MQILGPPPRPTSQKLQEWSSVICILADAPSDSNEHQVWRARGLDLLISTNQ